MTLVVTYGGLRFSLVRSGGGEVTPKLAGLACRRAIAAMAEKDEVNLALFMFRASSSWAGSTKMMRDGRTIRLTIDDLGKLTWRSLVTTEREFLAQEARSRGLAEIAVPPAASFQAARRAVHQVLTLEKPWHRPLPAFRRRTPEEQRRWPAERLSWLRIKDGLGPLSQDERSEIRSLERDLQAPPSRRDVELAA